MRSDRSDVVADAAEVLELARLIGHGAADDGELGNAKLLKARQARLLGRVGKEAVTAEGLPHSGCPVAVISADVKDDGLLDPC